MPEWRGFDRIGILDALNVRSYYQYAWGEPLAGKERIQMVARSNIREEGLDAFISSHPGQYWQIGNEPNVPNQDNLTPQEYAQVYYSWSRRIKTIDQSAKILNGGIVNYPDVVGYWGGALQYLKDFREAYRGMYGEFPSIDVWNLHAFPPFYYANGRMNTYCDTSFPKYFIVEVVQYLRSVGEQQPVWLTEFGMDWGDDSDPCMLTFMTDLVHWLEDTRLIDRWYWFSTNAASRGNGGNLVDLSSNLTAPGTRYRDLASERR
ncbi:MAG: hypothetical protein HY675_11695 [Chloroflexi bacterium]|nr:hypothetical protein [Chloroflexota bacterium]